MYSDFFFWLYSKMKISVQPLLTTALGQFVSLCVIFNRVMQIDHGWPEQTKYIDWKNFCLFVSNKTINVCMYTYSRESFKRSKAYRQWLCLFIFIHSIRFHNLPGYSKKNGLWSNWSWFFPIWIFFLLFVVTINFFLLLASKVTINRQNYYEKKWLKFVWWIIIIIMIPKNYPVIQLPESQYC